MSPCIMSFVRSGGNGSGATIPFRALKLGAPVTSTTTSFPTGGSSTANFALAEQRKWAGLPYAPPVVDPESASLPETFAVGRDASTTAAQYQRLPLTASRRVAEPFGLIYSQKTSPTRGRIVALTLSIVGSPASPPRLRVTIGGLADRGCRSQTVDVYAPAMSATEIQRLFADGGQPCSWTNLSACTRAQWPHGRVLFVSPLHDNTFEYRWIDYDMLASWRFGEAGRPKA